MSCVKCNTIDSDKNLPDHQIVIPPSRLPSWPPTPQCPSALSHPSLPSSLQHFSSLLSFPFPLNHNLIVFPLSLSISLQICPVWRNSHFPSVFPSVSIADSKSRLDCVHSWSVEPWNTNTNHQTSRPFLRHLHREFVPKKLLLDHPLQSILCNFCRW